MNYVCMQHIANVVKSNSLLKRYYLKKIPLLESLFYKIHGLSCKDKKKIMQSIKIGITIKIFSMILYTHFASQPKINSSPHQI